MKSLSNENVIHIKKENIEYIQFKRLLEYKNIQHGFTLKPLDFAGNANYEENKKGERTWIKETWFYQEGMKHLEGPIADGKRNGTFKTYYKSGSLMSIGDFKDGKREGKAVVYHENGKVYYEGFYKEGKECGVWKFYDEKGNLYNELNKD